MPVPTETIAVFIPIVALFIPISAIVTHHLRKIEEIRYRAGNRADSTTQAQLDAMKAELIALRDTSTKFDLEFDKALDDVDKRLQRVEEKTLSRYAEKVVEPIEQSIGHRG
jgi:hypothetical protein